MSDPTQYRYVVPNDISLQRHLLHAYHDSLTGMHHGRDATYEDFYWRHLVKHVRHWVSTCSACLRFKSISQPHGPMQTRLYERPFHTLDIDFIEELPKSPNRNKWIMTVVCPYSNFLRAIPVLDKSATTAARDFFDHVLLLYSFPSVRQSDRGGEWLNAVLHKLTQLLSIQQVFTTSYRPRLNGSTESVHRFLNAVIGIYCEHHRTLWEEYLQPAVYVHNVTPITKIIDPFYLIFGRHASSPEVLFMELPPSPLTCDDYATYFVRRMHKAQKEVNTIKNIYVVFSDSITIKMLAS